MLPVHGKCYLVCVKDPQLKIMLPHKKKVYVGAKRQATSRSKGDAHIIAIADLYREEVCVKNILRGFTWCKRKLMDFNEEITVRHGDHVGLQDGKLDYQVMFFSTRHALKSEPKTKKSKGVWDISHEVLVYTPPHMKPSNMIAGFNLMGTLVNNTGSRWNFTCESVPEMLNLLHRDGYKIVVLTGNLLTTNFDMTLFKKKITQFMRRINVPMQVFMSLANYTIEKPAPGLSAVFKQRQQEPINDKLSFFVGNHPGRVHTWMKGKQIRFITPEEFFFHAPMVSYCLPQFSPYRYITLPHFIDYNAVISETQELLVLVGPPNSGKSWLCKSHLAPAGYVHIYTDNDIELQRICNVIRRHLIKGKHVVVDGMNPTVEERKMYVDVAKNCDVKIRCIEMYCARLQLIHNRRFREQCKSERNHNAREVMRFFSNYYQRPDESEGFSEVKQLNFCPSFDDPKFNELYSQFSGSDSASCYF